MRHPLALPLLTLLALLAVAPAASHATSARQTHDTAGLQWLEGAYFNSGASVIDLGAGRRKLFGKLGLVPLFKRDKDELALDLTFYFDETSGVRRENWDSGKDILGKVLFYRHNTPEDIYSFAVEPIDEMTFGSGSILREFSNSIRYPLTDRKLAATAKWNSGYDDMGLVFVDDITDPHLFGARGALQPHDNLVIGATAVTDRGVPTRFGERDVTVAGVDVAVPFRSQSNIDFKLYAEANRMVDLGDGTHTGVEVDLGDVTWRTEYRRFDSGYIPNYFDRLYDIERSYKGSSLYALQPGAKESGWFNELRTVINRNVSARASYQKDYAVNRFPHLSLGLDLKDLLVPDLTFSFAYDRKNLYYSPTRESGALWSAKAAYDVDGRTHVIYEFKHLLDTWGNPVNSINLETRIKF